MITTDPEEVAVQVFRASELRAAKPGRGRFWTVFGTQKSKLQTSIVQDNHGSPIWNTQGVIPLQLNDRVLKFKVLDGDHVCGQIQIPVSQIPRRQEEAFPVQAPLQQHKRCSNPAGVIVYCCHVSKFRSASASSNGDQRGNQEPGSRRGSLNVINSLSSSLTNLVKLRSSSKSGRGEDQEMEPSSSSRLPGSKAESRRRAESPGASKSRGSLPNVMSLVASRAPDSASNGSADSKAQEPAGASWRVYEVDDPEVASAESASVNSISSLPIASTQRTVAPPNPPSTVQTARRVSTSSTPGALNSYNKPVPLPSSGPSYGSSAYSSGSSYSSNVHMNVNSVAAASMTSSSLTLSTGEGPQFGLAPGGNEFDGRSRAGSNQAPPPVLPSQYQFQKGHSIHGTTVVSSPATRGAAPANTAESSPATPSSVNFAKRPRITQVDPPEGSVQGGTKLCIRGENLGDQQTDVRAVYICGANCISSLFWRSSCEIVVTTKPWRECTGFIVVETPHGRSNSAVQFTFRDYKAHAQTPVLSIPSQPQPQQVSASPASAGGLPSAQVRRRLSTANLGLECETTDTVQVGASNVNLAVNFGQDSQLATFANPLELTSEICRLRSRVQELETQNAQLRTDGERMQQYIDSLTQKILSRCPEVLCNDNSAEKAKAAAEKQQQQQKQRTRSSSLFSLFTSSKNDDEKSSRKETVEQLRQFSTQQNQNNANINVNVNVNATPPRRSLAPSSNGTGGMYEPSNPSMIMTNEIMQL